MEQNAAGYRVEVPDQRGYGQTEGRVPPRITTFSGVLTKDAILSIHWDKKNHLYALSASKLYVFTVTSTSIVPVATYPIASGKGLFVVPK